MNIKKALVVDDSKVAHLTLRKLLLERGIEVDWVGSGEDCVKYLENKRPDIVFMDVMMPGMDGFETTRAITGLHPTDSAPTIMCSANATEEDKRDARESGAVGFLSKPYTPAQLDDILRMVSEGTAAIAIEELASAEPAIPMPAVIEKAPAPYTPSSAEAPLPAVAPMAGVPAAAGEVEQLAERVAWAAAEKVARDIIQELVPNLAREVAVQAARGVAEDLGRRAAHAAVRAAQESARAVAEQAAREVSEGISQRNIARGLEVNRDELLQQIEVQVDQKSRETLVFATSTPEFKQQILQMVRSGIQPVIETIARETAERSVQQSASNFTAQGGSAESRANLALGVGVVALLGAAAALLGYIFKLF